MSINPSRLWLYLPVLIAILAACGTAPAETTPTPDPGTVLTAAAQTAEVRLTEQARPIETPTQPPTSTAAPVTPTSPPTQTPTLDLLATITPTGGQAGGDMAEYVADISIPDGTDLAPGESFTKTWRLRNSGTSVWTTNYALAFIGGSQMGGPNAVPLAQSVNPGETVDISVDLVAPSESGTYKGFWEMQDAGGRLFPNAVFVEIDVVGGTTPAQGTAPPPGQVRVTDADLRVDDPSHDECPHTFAFTASFSLTAPATVTYQLEASTDTPGFEFSLPNAFTGQFAAGDHTVLYNLDLSNSVEAVVQFHVLSPDDLNSNPVTISLNCP